MADVWSNVAGLDDETQERLAGVLETRGADPQQQEMRHRFLAAIELSAAARVLEVGCGTGVLTRTLAQLAGVASVVGVDLAPSLIEKARELASGLPDVTFEVADAASLPFAEASFDVVVFDSTLSHVPDSRRAVEEAFRVLRPAGVLAAFDGDYATATVAVRQHDPLQTCVDAMLAGSVHDRFVLRQLPALVRECGFQDTAYRSYGFAETGEGVYMLTVVDRGAEVLLADGVAGEELVAALKAEARRRVEAGSFFGHIAYGSVTALKR